MCGGWGQIQFKSLFAYFEQVRRRRTNAAYSFVNQFFFVPPVSGAGVGRRRVPPVSGAGVGRRYPCLGLVLGGDVYPLRLGLR